MSTPEAADIRRRVDDAQVLWQFGRRESAFILVLVAVSAAAKRAYPALGDRAGFEAFLTACTRWRLSVEFQGGLHTIETLLYKHFRCQLVHEAGLAADVQFLDHPDNHELIARAGGAPEYVLKLSPGWFHHLATCTLTGL